MSTTQRQRKYYKLRRVSHRTVLTSDPSSKTGRLQAKLAQIQGLYSPLGCGDILERPVELKKFNIICI